MTQAQWFTEQAAGVGTAFGLKINAKVHEEQSPFQHIEIYQTETFGYLMVIDGCTMVSTRDNFFYHEMLSHPVLFSHPNPKKVWIIGGGDCGTLHEVLKHPGVEQVIQIEIDERVTRLAEQYFPELCASNNDPRADLKFIDGIEWVKNAAKNAVDLIIIDSTDPIGPAEGLFGKAFYQDCLRCLSPDGMIVQQSESPLVHLPILQDMRQAMREAGFAQIESYYFPQCIYPSGWWSATVAGKSSVIGFREADARNKPFTTRYYNADIHRAAFAQPEFMRA